jgi:hypothetical protein
MMEKLQITLFTFIPEEAFWWLVVLSVLGFLGSLILIPVILVRLPPTYFEAHHPRRWLQGHHPILRLLAHVVKNIAGGVFLVAGLAMLVLPGQGLLTMLIGLSLLDFPGKRRLEAAVISRPGVLRAINALRAKFGRPPLTISPAP